MASRTSRREWVRGLPSAFGLGRYGRKQFHSALERSVGYFFLIRKSVQSYPNPHPYQTGSKGYLYSPSCREGVFSETGLPAPEILGNLSSNVAHSRKLEKATLAFSQSPATPPCTYDDGPWSLDCKRNAQPPGD